MLVARFDFSWGDMEFHLETLENLKAAIKSTNKLCAVSLSFVYSIFSLSVSSLLFSLMQI